MRDQRASAPFRRLKPTLLLLLQILVILLLALALARPTRTVFVTGYERTVFILDLSASMQATDVAGSRFAAAKAALAAGLQGKYYEMIEALLQNQPSLGDEKYKELAGQIGLDVAKWEQDLKSRDAEFDAWPCRRFRGRSCPTR